MNIDTQCRAKVSAHTLVNFVEDESYLIHLVSQYTLHMNKLNTEFWDLLIRSHSVEQALIIFTNTRAGDDEQVTQKLLLLLEQLLACDFIELVTPDGSEVEPPAISEA